MRVIRKYRCIVCEAILVGFGDHMMQKYAIRNAGIDLKGKVEKHNRQLEHLKKLPEFHLYNQELAEYLNGINYVFIDSEVSMHIV